jgi:hypothetical protein
MGSDARNGVGGFAAESPFLSEYAAEGEEAAYDGSLDEVIGDFEAEAFGDGLQGLVDEIAGEASDRSDFEGEAGDEALAFAASARLTELESAAYGLIDRMGDAAGRLDAAAIAPAELEATLDAVDVGKGPSPAFEQFLSGLKKKLKGLAKKAVSLAKKGVAVAGKLAGNVLLGPLLAKVKGLVKPLLEKVLKIALDKIPEQYRPLAKQLAQKLGFAPPAAPLGAPTTAAAGSSPAEGVSEPTATVPAPGAAPEPSEPAAPAVEPLEGELDLQLAELLLAPPGSDDELMQSGLRHRAAITARDPIGDLARARARFVREIGALGEGDDATPAVERFVPAVMFAIRTGIKLIGRPRVVGFLGGLIGKLIGPLVGAKNGSALGRMIADVGLKTLLHAEVDPSEHPGLAGEALASSIEETVRRVAALPEEVLDDKASYEALAYEAFEAAVAANLPSDVVKADRREADGSAAWVHLPLRAPVYKKLGRVYDVVISPQVAAAVRTFGGGTLGSFFRDRLRLAAAPVAARVHVYEATPRTRLSRIARLEAVRGLGTSDRSAWSQIHPLTPDVSGLLLGAPRLGRELGEDADPAAPSIGQRYYFLEVHEAPARPLGAESHVHLAIDLPRGEIALCLHLSEVVAQSLSTALRKGAPPASVVNDLRAALAAQIGALASERPNRLVSVRFGHRPHRRHRSPVQQAARRALRQHIARSALDWCWAALAERLPQLSADFIAKTEGPEDGVVVRVAFPAPGLGGMRRFLAGGGGAAPEWSPKRPTNVSVTIVPGPKHG